MAIEDIDCIAEIKRERVIVIYNLTKKENICGGVEETYLLIIGSKPTGEECYVLFYSLFSFCRQKLADNLL